MGPPVDVASSLHNEWDKVGLVGVPVIRVQHVYAWWRRKGGLQSIDDVANKLLPYRVGLGGITQTDVISCQPHYRYTVYHGTYTVYIHYLKNDLKYKHPGTRTMVRTYQWYSTGCRVSSQNTKHTWFSVHMCALFQSESCDIPRGGSTYVLPAGSIHKNWTRTKIGLSDYFSP